MEHFMALSTLKATDSKSPNLGIDNNARAHIAERLSQALANSYALQLKTQYYHWNVTGPQFIALHKLLEEHYKDLQNAVDEIAERIRSLGHFTPGTFREFLETAVIKEDKSLPKSWDAMVKNLVDGHETLSRFFREAIPYVQELGDEATGDLCIRRQGDHEKTAWMLRAHLE
jgi:starvation-inducible DNA-binding protein